MIKMNLRLFLLPLSILAASPRSALAAVAAPDPTLQGLLPVPAEVRQILNQRCVMCHGEVIEGKAETREDLDLSTDDLIRETLSETGRLKQMILEDKMPQKAKFSFRLRHDPKMKERLETIKADYAKNGEKEKLLAWLKDIVATTGEKEDKKKDKE